MLEKIHSKTTTVITETNTYKTSIEGLTIIERIVNGRKPSYQLHGKGPHDSMPTIVKPEFYKFIKKYNPWSSNVPFNGNTAFGWSHIQNEKEKHTLKSLEKKINDGLVIYVFHSGHEMFDLNGLIIPYAKKFDYISTTFTNEHANLKELLEYLKTHDWVANKKDLHIESIPHYNRTDGRSEFIQVTIKPSTSAYNMLYLRATEGKGQHWSTKLDDYTTYYLINDKFDPMGLKPFLKKK